MAGGVDDLNNRVTERLPIGGQLLFLRNNADARWLSSRVKHIAGTFTAARITDSLQGARHIGKNKARLEAVRLPGRLPAQAYAVQNELDFLSRRVDIDRNGLFLVPAPGPGMIAFRPAPAANQLGFTEVPGMMGGNEGFVRAPDNPPVSQLGAREAA